MFGLCRKLARTRSTSSSAFNKPPLDFCLHKHLFSVDCLYHARMILSVGGSFAYFARNARCTVTTDLLVWHSSTQNHFSPGAAIFSLHTLASSSGRNVNYDEKQVTGGEKRSCYFCLYRFCKYVSYDFSIIHFCYPGVHYEIPYRNNVLNQFVFIFDIIKPKYHKHPRLKCWIFSSSAKQ